MHSTAPRQERFRQNFATIFRTQELPANEQFEDMFSRFEFDTIHKRDGLTIVVKNIDVRIKNIKKHVLYPIIKNMKKTFLKHFPCST